MGKWVGGRMQIPHAHDQRMHPRRHAVAPDLAILMLLMKLAHPTRYRPTMEMYFGQDKTRLSRFLNKALDHVFRMFAHTLAFDDHRLHDEIPYMAQCIAEKIGVDPDPFRVWGFVDGTFRRIARPGEGYYVGGRGWTVLTFSFHCDPTYTIVVLSPLTNATQGSTRPMHRHIRRGVPLARGAAVAGRARPRIYL